MTPMRTSVPEKLRALAEEIDERGQAALTRLTVLKKWFERPGRLPAFAVFIAARATSRKGKAPGEAATLFRESRALLARHDRVRPVLDREKARSLHERLVAFQNEYRDGAWGRIRVIHNWNLMLIEHALDIYLARDPAPAAGYKLAADYCQNYDASYGNSLNGPSSMKILEIVRWMFTLEAIEDLREPETTPAARPSHRHSRSGRGRTA
jgi:hypothetical protein